MNTQISDTEYRVQKKNHTNYLIFDRGPRELNGKKNNNNVSIHCVVALDINRTQK